MYSKNKTNLKKQIEWIVRYWLSKQENYEELNFFYNYELHQEELASAQRLHNGGAMETKHFKFKKAKCMQWNKFTIINDRELCLRCSLAAAGYFRRKND